MIEAGEEPATMAFLYDIESSSGNTGRGLIVVKVVRESVPDYPVVADTALTAETREDFPRGVDVLADKATWSGGDVSDLDVALWGEPEGSASTATSCAGELPATTRIIPFAVTGDGPAGEVTTYAFLRVPGDDDLELALKSGAQPPEVTELESVVVRHGGPGREAAREPHRGRGRRARFRRPRATPSCAVESGTVVRYDSGAGAPWVDACQVPVRHRGAGRLDLPVGADPGARRSIRSRR